MEIKEFREFVRKERTTMVLNQEALRYMFPRALDVDLLTDERKDLYDFICIHMGWADDETVRKLNRLKELKTALAELKTAVAELEEDLNGHR
jgi:hypothetical protein